MIASCNSHPPPTPTGVPRVRALSPAQTSIYISHIVGFDFLQGLICGVRRGELNSHA